MVFSIIAYVLMSAAPTHCISPNQKERVDDHIEGESGEGVARVVVVPHADLYGNDNCSVEKEQAARDEHHCNNPTVKQ